MPRVSDVPLEISLVDRQAPLVRAWERAFADYPEVTVVQGDFFARPADAMVSPANSFGIMDGGLDLAIRDVLGHAVQREVQRRIVEEHHGELPVGQAFLVATGHASWPLLVCAPTMRIPESAAQTTHAYLAFRATLLAVRAYNREHPDAPARSLLCPGLGTGIGAMDETRCAVQMKLAYDHVNAPARIPSAAQIHAIHRALRTS